MFDDRFTVLYGQVVVVYVQANYVVPVIKDEPGAWNKQINYLKVFDMFCITCYVLNTSSLKMYTQGFPP